MIHGGVKREERRKVQELFRNDPTARVLVATDAAGEGVNLQNANLMVNYDPPLEPESAGTALRPHPPHRPDRGPPPVEHGGFRDAREGDVFQRLSSRSWRSSEGPGRPSVRHPRRGVQDRSPAKTR